jgi:hypothetical protein
VQYAAAQNPIKHEGLLMSDVLKGNYQTKKKVTANKQQGESLEERFEREALKKLGGSIAFVAKKKVAWSIEDEDK